MQFPVILGMLLTIVNCRQTTRQDLAEKFEIDKRTVSRYLDVIARAGIPVESLSGIGGGVRLPDTFKLDRTFFSKEELKMLSTSVHAMRFSMDGKAAALLIDKINNMANNKEDEKYLLKSETLIIDIGTWTNPQVYRNKIETINKAITHELTIALRYTNRNELSSERNFDPYTLVLKEGVWYLYGWCHLRMDFRLLKLNRIQSMTITSQPFSRRESNVFDKLREGFDDSDIIEVELEFYNTVLQDIEEWLGINAISERGTMYYAKASLYGGNMLVNKLLSFGSSVKVISPPALREELAVECKRIFRIYE